MLRPYKDGGGAGEVHSPPTGGLLKIDVAMLTVFGCELRYATREMSDGMPLREFVEAAKAQGASEETVAGVLRGRGWSNEDIYRALADYYERRSGLKVPVYKRSGSAKDAFLYLLSFSTLATWTIGAGSVMFTLIERWFKDPLSPATYPSYYSNNSYEMANSLACVIVAFPIYVFVMRYIVRELEGHPGKLESPVRKWLTYLALLITACVVVGDLISFLTYFLRGEITARFVAKSAVVLVLAGGVFWYYFGSLQRDTAMAKGGHE